LTSSKILLGYELGTGKPVEMGLHHLIVTGMTGESGKTTTIEALLSRANLTSLVFRTKRGELGFKDAHEMLLYFSEKGLTEWRALEGLLSATLNEKVQREPGVRAAIINLCSDGTSLKQIYDKNRKLMKDAKGFMRDVREKINAYLDLVLPQLQVLNFVNVLTLKRGSLNVMDLEGLSDEMQNLVIFATTEYLYRYEKEVILVVPEAPKFIPQDRGSPCKVAFEKYIREGRAIGNFLWIDTQDLRGVDKKYLRHCDNWILGRQRFMLEVESTLDAIPLPKQDKPKPEEIQRLGKGQFFACLHNDVKKVYVQPIWLDSHMAQTVARTEAPAPSQPKLIERVPPPYIPSSVAAVETDDGPIKTIQPVELTDVENVYTVIHKENPLTMSTSGRSGQIMLVLLEDLKAPSTTTEIAQAMAEHGWYVSADSVRLQLLNMVTKQGLLIRDGDKYRLPYKVRIEVRKE
jgi:hypothetical protein